MDDDTKCANNWGYCTPEDAIEILGLIDNTTGCPAHFSDKTNPTYESVCRRIEAMSAKFDNDTRDSWQTHVVRDHIFDRGRSWSLNNLRSYMTPIGKGGWASQLTANILEWEPALGDKLEYRTSNNKWVDITNEYGNLFWFDYEAGLFYFTSSGYVLDNTFRISYRYGRREGVPPDIRDAVAKKVAIWIMQTDFYRTTLGQGSGLANKKEIIDAWNKDYDNCVLTHMSSSVAISILP